MFTHWMIYEGWAITGDHIAEGRCVADTTEARTERIDKKEDKIMPS